VCTKADTLHTPAPAGARAELCRSRSCIGVWGVPSLTRYHAVECARKTDILRSLAPAGARAELFRSGRGVVLHFLADSVRQSVCGNHNVYVLATAGTGIWAGERENAQEKSERERERACEREREKWRKPV